MLKFMTSAVALCALAGPAFAGSLSDVLKPSEEKQAVKVTVGCGHPEKANCKLLLRIQAESFSHGEVLEPFTSKGTVESAIGVCSGAINAAIGQRDGFDQIWRASSADDPNVPSSGCAGKFKVVGRPLYPYFGYLVVRNDDPASSLSALAKEAPKGKFVAIAAGELGSGGQTTIWNILNTLSDLKQRIHVEDISEADALPALQRGEINAYFVMDGPHSSLVDRIKDAKDEKGKPLFKFAEIDLDRKFYSKSTDATGSALYYSQEISGPGGWFTSGGKTTIATDAVLVVNTDFGNQNRGAVRTLVDSIDKAQAAIRADVQVPENWKPQN